MPLTQTARQIAIDTPLGEDAVLLRSVMGQEAISRLFSFELDLVSEEPSINYDDIVGQSVTVRVTLADGSSSRYWNGYVSRFVQAGRDANVAVYHATMVPWLWFWIRPQTAVFSKTKPHPTSSSRFFKSTASGISLSTFMDRL